MARYLTIVVLLVLGAAAAWYWSVQRDQQEIREATVLPPPTVAPEPEIRHPVENIQAPPIPEAEPEAEPKPLPEPLAPLAESDSVMRAEAEELLGPGPVEEYLVKEMLVSRLVATVDSLTSARVAPLMLPFKPVPGRFLVLEAEDELVVSPANAERYQPYLDALLALESEQLVPPYLRYYPWFQEAYEQLGYPEGYFNDRLVAVIDHLLATPEPRGLLPVRQNEAVYEYEDEALESLSAGQKMLLRLGYENQRAVKDRLRRFRAAITGSPPGAD
jgi:hypothetical protein